MKPAIRIAPSILAADFGKLAAEVQAVANAGADWIHVDVMDGHFVPNLTIGPPVVKAVRRATGLPLDVHLMIEAPERSLAEYAAAGADRIDDVIRRVTVLRDAWHGMLNRQEPELQPAEALVA